jgi:hypothetical protein
MKKSKTARPRNMFAIFYKSHGKFIGPYEGELHTKRQIKELEQSGVLKNIRNYVLHSPLQLRRRVYPIS